MGKRLREFHDKSIVHAAAPGAAGFTLCGLALEGENGDAPMEETRDLIRCGNCEAIILHCKTIKPSEINKFSRRRLEAARAARR
jgi:hypothetical protein